jgi:hypothetical protein
MSNHLKEPHQRDEQSSSITDGLVEQANFPSVIPASIDANVTGYYVIIGCGVAAVVNHTTLRQTEWGKQRIGDLSVMHIGFDDPWSHYHPHKMGQSRNLLTFPGYEKRFDPEKEKGADQPRMSNLFAEDTRHEQERLRAEYVFKVRRGFVALIQPSWVKAIPEDIQQALNGEEIDTHLLNTDFELETPYRLLVVGTDRKSQLIYAYKIDICTGPGRPRVLKDLSESLTTGTITGKGISTSGLTDYDWKGTKPWEPPEVWSTAIRGRHVICGAEALYQETDWDKGNRVCVMGEGGIGVNMVERGENAGCWLDWIAKVALSYSSFGNPRNHWLLKHPLAKPTCGKRMEFGEFKDWKNLETVCEPALKEWRFGRDSVISDVRKENGKLKIFYRAYDPSGIKEDSDPLLYNYYATGHPLPQVRDYYEKDTSLTNECFPYSSGVQSNACPPLEAESYHRLVICAGQDGEKVGQPYLLTKMLQLDPILTPDGRMVGMGTNNDEESVRVLGAAAYTITRGDTRPKKPERDHLDSLPRQAQFTGLTFCGVCIAHANHYFDTDNPNTNVNTATMAEIELQVGVSLASDIVKFRKASPNGFTTCEELENELRASGVDLTGREKYIKKLSTTYRPPDPFWH